MKRYNFTKQDMLNLNIGIIKNLIFEADAYPDEDKKLKNLILSEKLIKSILISYGINTREAEPRNKQKKGSAK